MRVSRGSQALWPRMPTSGVRRGHLLGQDLSRLGRDMRRTVLVDDTPLAFLAQPDNGIPIFNFRCAAYWTRCCTLPLHASFDSICFMQCVVQS